ncbi:putative invertase inhibitor [Elaeis guineensis]|uniref:Invertase inhibitor n=1 Tax=Elaeis guineensis var. tenera TaxID=51953 RepID=A0A6I9RXL1_ELAGV|nr:putative invertase inhibitor [Elaeis guineensis]
MRPLIPLSHTTILSLLLISSIAKASILEETCKSVAAARPNIGYEFCATSLRADPGSSSADLHGLAVIATRLSLADATNTESRINQLMVVESKKPFLKDCLSVCSEVYSEAIDHLNDASRNLEARLYREAVTFLSAALDAPDNCEDAFSDAGSGGLSPLAREDEDYGRLADVALTITASLG